MPPKLSGEASRAHHKAVSQNNSRTSNSGRSTSDAGSIESNQLHVRNIHLTLDEAALRTMFGQYGTVTECNRIHRYPNLPLAQPTPARGDDYNPAYRGGPVQYGYIYAFVHMSSAEEASEAKKALHGKEYMPGWALTVTTAREPGRKRNRPQVDEDAEENAQKKVRENEEDKEEEVEEEEVEKEKEPEAEKEVQAEKDVNKELEKGRQTEKEVTQQMEKEVSKQAETEARNQAEKEARPENDLTQQAEKEVSSQAEKEKAQDEHVHQEKEKAREEEEQEEEEPEQAAGEDVTDATVDALCVRVRDRANQENIPLVFKPTTDPANLTALLKLWNAGEEVKRIAQTWKGKAEAAEFTSRAWSEEDFERLKLLQNNVMRVFVANMQANEAADLDYVDLHTKAIYNPAVDAVLQEAVILKKQTQINKIAEREGKGIQGIRANIKDAIKVVKEKGNQRGEVELYFV